MCLQTGVCEISQMCLQTGVCEMLGMKVLFFPVDIVLLFFWALGGGYEGTLLSRGDIDMFFLWGLLVFKELPRSHK